MTNKKSYLVKAIYDWINDNNCTPHILIDTKFPKVDVPTEYISQSQIAFNISKQAICNLTLDTDYMSFQASFNGIAHTVKFPVYAIKAIYAEEDVNEGMNFIINYGDAKLLDGNKNHSSTSKLPGDKKRNPNKKAHLRIVK